MQVNPFARAGSPARASCYLGLDAFTEMYAATAFASFIGAPLDTSVCLVWGMLGATTPKEVQDGFTAFTKCLRDWLAQRCIPAFWIFVHENGSKRGLHTHLALYVPGWPAGEQRREFRQWLKAWIKRRYPQAQGRAVRVRGRSLETDWLGWHNFSYCMKGADPACMVVSGRHTQSGKPTMLGELIGAGFKHPGRVPLRHQWGVSSALGAESRELGVDPRCYTPSTKRWIISSPFRSAFDDGARDVRELYPKSYVMKVRGKWSKSTSQADPQQPAAAESDQEPVCQYQEPADDDEGLSEFELAIRSLEDGPLEPWH